MPAGGPCCDDRGHSGEFSGHCGFVPHFSSILGRSVCDEECHKPRGCGGPCASSRFAVFSKICIACTDKIWLRVSLIAARVASYRNTLILI